MKKILNLSFVLFFFVLGVFLLPSHKVSAAPSVSVTATPSSIASGGYSWITWSSSGATACYRTDTGGSVALNDSVGFRVGPLYSTTTFSIRCTAPDAVCNSYYLDIATCFIADTKVIMSDGSTKNIQDVKVGDVLKGEKTNNKVLGLHQPELSGKLYSFNGGRYFVTEEHPFKTTDGWKSINPKKTALENIGIEVSPLDIGDTLVTEKGNILLKTIDSKEGKDNTDLFNFILDGDHTYYADGYLVHNKTECGSGYPTCPTGQICLGSYGHCGVSADRKVVGSCGYVDGVYDCPGPYEGMLCSYFSDQANCQQGWATHGCTWVTGSPTCASCPGTCPSGYTASCVGNRTYCVENQPCGSDSGQDLCATYGGKCSSKFSNDTICYTLETKAQCQSKSQCQWLLCPAI